MSFYNKLEMRCTDIFNISIDTLHRSLILTVSMFSMHYSSAMPQWIEFSNDKVGELSPIIPL